MEKKKHPEEGLAEPEEEQTEGLQRIHGADKKAHWVKMLAAKRGDLSSVSGTNTVTGETGCLQVLS